MQKTAGKYLKMILLAALCGAAVWLLLKYVLKWLAPFIIAYAAAWAMQPAVNWMTVHLRVKKAFACTVCSLALLSVLGGTIFLVVWRAVYEASELVSSMPEIIQKMSNTALEFKDRIFVIFSRAPEELNQFLSSQIAGASEKILAWASLLTEKIISAMSAMAAAVPGCIVCIVTTVISIFFFSSRYVQVRDFIKRQLPQKYHGTVSGIKNAAFSALGKWFKAQLLLSAVTFCELSVGFCILKIPWAVLLALLIALIDALPVLGTGIILVPWACVTMLSGNFQMALGLLIIYAVVVIVHNCLEPKLVSTQLGTNPIATLMAMYIGYKTVGVGGMIVFPMVFVIIKQLNDGGYLRLWK
jgi:sporulation integral membrane protein YtvI